jgi:putative transposase
MRHTKAYKALPAKLAQWVLRLLDQNWQSSLAALAARPADPSKLLGRPKSPGYKDKRRVRNLLVYTFQALSIPALRAGAIVSSKLSVSVRTEQQTVQHARIVSLIIPRFGF